MTVHDTAITTIRAAGVSRPMWLKPYRGWIRDGFGTRRYPRYWPTLSHQLALRRGDRPGLPWPLST
jgi:hypothetical protein